ISSFGRRPSSAHIAESKSLKNSGENTFCQSSARQWDWIYLETRRTFLFDHELARHDMPPFSDWRELA
ncbi:hypothetical protein, partial [Bradyrhizobium sp. 151]|uniref:hypothetical protein n=1 Tax=Bradyrhizobium sp. 151 TaxID=2782626 RepID=UPI001FF75A13